MKVGLLKDGGFACVYCTENTRTFRISSRIKIAEDQWDKKLRQPIKGSLTKEEEGLLEQLVSQMNTAVLMVRVKGIPTTIENVRKEFYSRNKGLKEEKVKKEKKALNLLSSFKAYIKVSEPRVSWNHCRNMNSTYSVLDKFVTYRKKQLQVHGFDRKVGEEFINYLITQRKVQDATVVKYVTALKAFFKKTYPEIDVRFFNYKVVPKNIITITEQEIDILKSATGLSKHLARTRDLFLFICHTGMRHSDTLNMEQDWVEGDVIIFNQKKTKGLAITFMFKIVKDILSRYEGVAPKICQQVFNRQLKDLFKKLELHRKVKHLTFIGGKMKQEFLPLSEVITSHVGRKSFITIALSKGIPIQDVMKMSGHSDFRSMKPYISISKEHIKDVSKKWDV